MIEALLFLAQLAIVLTVILAAGLLGGALVAWLCEATDDDNFPPFAL